MITKATLSPPTPDNLPVLSSDDLEITSWERLGHGGHSYVFLVTIPGRSPSVVKIFRFNLERADPYLHFRRESTSYSLLCRAGLLGTVVPAVHGVLRISPSHEAALAAEEKLGGLQAMRYRVRSATAPLMAVWMEFVPGRRLSRDDVGVSVRAEGVTRGLDKIHDAGVLQGDVKWRNIMVADDADRGVVWIDFSTSDAHDDGPTDQSWQEKVQVEKNKLEDMLGRYRQVRTRFFLFLFLSYDPVDKKSASGRCASLEGNAAKIWRPRKYNKAPLPLSTLPRVGSTTHHSNEGSPFVGFPLFIQIKPSLYILGSNSRLE